jgi:hypothetical protein
MKKYFFILLLTPLINLSQIGISVSGSSQFTTGQTIIPLMNGEFESVNYELRNNSISLDWTTGRRLVIGEIWCVLGVKYAITNSKYNSNELNYNIANYKLVERRLIPSLAIQYVLMQRGFFRIYSSLGTYAILENLNLNQDNSSDIQVQQYNSLIPFIRTGLKLSMGNFTINPFIGYEFETIYFDTLNEISSADIENAIKNAGIRTGLRFGILF